MSWLMLVGYACLLDMMLVDVMFLTVLLRLHLVWFKTPRTLLTNNLPPSAYDITKVIFLNWLLKLFA